MNMVLMIESPMIWVFVLAVIVLLFGGSKLPQLAKALGQSKRAFHEGQAEAEEAARQAKAGQMSEAGDNPTLAAVDDEQLFEEARRRAALRRAGESTGTVPETNRLSEARPVDKAR